MAFFKSMRHIRQVEFYFFYFVWNKGSWCFKTVSEFSSHNFSTDQHLVPTHWIGPGPPAPRRGVHGSFRELKVIGENIYNFYNKICIGSCNAYCKISNNGTSQCQIFIQNISLKSQYICSSCSETLVIVHISSSTIEVNIFSVRNRMCRIADIFT